MYIPYFSGHQDDVFIPAILLAFVAAVLIALPVVFAPAVRRMRAGRAAVGAVGVVAALLLVAAVAVAVPGFGTIAQQRASVRAQIDQRYGLALAPDEVARLVNGDTIKGLRETSSRATVRLARVSLHHYVLIGTPKSTTKTLELPRA